MPKETLTLTQAIRDFSQGQSAKKADRLHRLFKDGTYFVPVSIAGYPSAKEALEAFKSLERIPFVIVQHPEVGSYIPIFTDESLLNPAIMPENTIHIQVNFPALSNLLRQAGPEVPAIIFDPDQSGLMFSREKFLAYCRDLLESEKKQEKKLRPDNPEGEITLSVEGPQSLDKNRTRQLIGELRRDARIEGIWLRRDTYQNGVDVYTLEVLAPDQDESVLKKAESLLKSRLARKDHLNAVLVENEPEGLPLYKR